LPPYSPDFNPIEESFSALKAWMKRNREIADNFQDDFEGFITLAIEEFMVSKDATGYFLSAGIGIDDEDE
jgi:DDE superfamily endonuclease